MTQVEIDGILMTICKNAGLSKNIDIRHAAKIGSQIGGEWEFDWRQKGPDGIILTITYWHNSMAPDSETVFITWDALKSDKTIPDISGSVIEKIDELKVRINT